MNRRPIQASIRGTGTEESAERDALLDAYARWAAGVALLVVRDEDGDVEAITVSAFTPVSADPPLVLVCVGTHAGILPMIQETGRFTLNVLAEDDRRAAAAGAQRMPPDPQRLAADGDPLLRGALASLVCTFQDEHPGGDHAIVVGRVERVVVEGDAPPLIHYARGYRGLRDGPP